MTKTYDPENERIKHRYFSYLREANRFSEDSVDVVAAALTRFESYTRFRPFSAFHIQQATAFKRHLAEQVSRRTKERLSKATIYHTCAALKAFFHWLAGQPGFRKRLSYSDAEYFNISAKDARIATAHREQAVPTLDQIRHVLSIMPAIGEIALRNRALIALTLLTGARDGAIASLKLKHLDLRERLLRQDARDVDTKFGKTFPTWFFPVGDEVRIIVEEWVHFLETEKLWGPTDPLFPSTLVEVGPELRFQAKGLDRNRWTNANPIRRIFKEAFALAGLPYFNPHSFRKTLVRLGERLCQTPEEFKAWSQNLGHEKVMTTFTSYGNVASGRQAEIIKKLGLPKAPDDLLDQLKRMIGEAQRSNPAET